MSSLLLAGNNIHLDVTDKVKEKLVDLWFDPKMGARPRRTIQDYIEDAITDYYENQAKDLKAAMTSKGNIQIKSAKKSWSKPRKL